MPQIGANNEPLLERAIFGYDGTDYRVVKVDASGNLVAAVLADQNVQARLHGYDGTNWRKLQQVFGYTDRVVEKQTTVSTGAGTTAVDSTAVEAGYVHVISSVAAWHSNVGALFCVLQFYNGTNYLEQSIAPALAQYTLMSLSLPFVLKASDSLRFYAVALPAGQSVFLSLNGYKMKIND
jgi:hypothetical protein